MKEIPFVVTDRRGAKKEPRVDHSVKAEPEATGDPNVWEDYCFVSSLAAAQNGQPIPLGRVIGLRGDGMSCFADYIFPQFWKEGFDWMALLKKRLDSFLGCACTDTKMCATHLEYSRQWGEADIGTISMTARSPMPKALEAFIRKMNEQKPKIVAPGLN